MIFFIKRKLIVSLLLMLVFVSGLSGQTERIIMSYNLLSYPGSDASLRNDYFKTVLESILPDVLVVQEITSQAGVNGFLTNVLNQITGDYAAGVFINGPDTDNAIFYKTSSFTFLANNPISTNLRNISEFILTENTSGDTIRIYSVHLKASSGSANEQQRLAEVTILRGISDALPSNTNFLVLGDFNIYGANEPAYIKLLDQSSTGYCIDIYTLPGGWNSSAYAQYHTQSTRTRQFGGGASSGLDDRFDMILMSQAIIDPGRISYKSGSYTEYGNDGNHYNDSINKPPNTVVSQTIANALHYASDHLPVYASFTFESPVQPTFAASVTVDNAWNLVSVPGNHPNSMHTDTLFRFRDYSSNVFLYDGFYSSVDTLTAGRGYWLKHISPYIYNWNGSVQGGVYFPELYYSESVNTAATQGWNIIGCLDYQFPVSALSTEPPGLITGSAFSYQENLGYRVATTIEPGKAYWIFLSGPGQIIYPDGSRNQKESDLF
jgi:endonuclease/exonuclease/phosphatase family metal-dependent hydrolase